MKKEPSDLKRLSINQRQIHQQNVNKIISDTYNDSDYHYRINKYNKLKHMHWYHYLISLAVVLFVTGLSFLIGFLARNSLKMPNYQATGWVSLIIEVVIITIMMVLNWFKNRQAAIYFQDKRRRYQRTLSKNEAKIFLTNKILFLSAFLLIPVVIATNICFQ